MPTRLSTISRLISGHSGFEDGLSSHTFTPLPSAYTSVVLAYPSPEDMADEAITSFNTRTKGNGGYIPHVRSYARIWSADDSLYVSGMTRGIKSVQTKSKADVEREAVLTIPLSDVRAYSGSRVHYTAKDGRGRKRECLAELRRMAEDRGPRFDTGVTDGMNEEDGGSKTDVIITEWISPTRWYAADERGGMRWSWCK